MQKISLTQTGLLPPITVDYINQEEKLKSFYKYTPNIDSFGEAIKNKNYNNATRAVLVDVLLKQYAEAGIELNNETKAQIEKIKNNNTFTVTTGHQLALFTGPLYFIYKIVTIINLAEQLKAKYPEQHFVPVFWLASEDHDFEEISTVQLFGKQVKWQNETNSKPVGRVNNKGLTPIIDEIASILGERQQSKNWIELLKKCYSPDENLSVATRRLVYELFKNEGLIIIDADNADLKKELQPIIEQDVLNQTTFKAIKETNKRLEESYKLQINGREVNFFYLHNEFGRKLIKQEGNGYKLQDTSVVFTKEEMAAEIANNPAMFSPNVVLRPVYQELILPNLAYIGGPAEVAYWLQLKNVFDTFNIAYPVLMQRNSFLLLNKSISDKAEKMGLTLVDLFLNDSELADLFLQKQSSSNLPEVINQIDTLFQSIIDEVKNIDQTTTKEILALKLENKKQLGTHLKSYKKARQQKQEDNIEKLLKLKERLFPLGVFQERSENVMMYDLNPSLPFISKVKQHADAFDFSLHIIDD
ncbi:MAG: bacillithiol biosynthesis cysteine-adding enzyme BshC [Bacteroidota bacterium]